MELIPRIAIVSSHPIQYNAPLFELLAKRNRIDIKVFYTWGADVLKDKFDPGFGKIITWDIPLLNGYAYEFLKNTSPEKGSHHFNGIINPDIITRINNYAPHSILVYGWAFKSHLSVLRHFKNKIPVFFRGDSTLLDKNNLLSSFKNLFLRWVYTHVDAAFYVGKNNYEYFRKAGLGKRQLVFGPHAIDNDRFSKNSIGGVGISEDLKKELKLADKDFVFLFAGKLEEKKDPAILLNAFVSASLGPKAKLIIAGNGPLEMELKEKYSTFSNIHFIDFQNQLSMPGLYAIADVFILPSKGPGETWGLSVNEAMACGKAIIVSDKCGCAIDLVKDSVNGYIFKAGDCNNLMQKLKMIYSQKEKLSQMSIESLAIINNFSFNILAFNMEERFLVKQA